MSGLDVYIQPESSKPGDLVAVLARAAAVKDVIAEREQTIRDRLEQSVRVLAEAAGGQFTVRADAGTAYIAGGNPVPKVVDVDALGTWLNSYDGNIPDAVKQVTTVDVTDPDRLLWALSMFQAGPSGTDPDDWWRGPVDAVRDAVAVRERFVVREDLVDDCLSSGMWKVVDDRVVDTRGGEVVPGIEVGYSRETLTVRPDKAFRGQVAEQIRASLPEVDGGGS